MTNSISQVCLTTFLFQSFYFKDAIPVPENLEDLLAELEAAQKAEKDNEKRADTLLEVRKPTLMLVIRREPHGMFLMIWELWRMNSRVGFLFRCGTKYLMWS